MIKKTSSIFMSEICGSIDHQLPEGAEILRVGHDVDQQLRMWYLYDPSREETTRTFTVLTDGWSEEEIADGEGLEYLGSFPSLGPMSRTWGHVFEVHQIIDDLSKDEVLMIIREINDEARRIKSGEIVPKVRRIADRGNTAFTIRVENEEK